MSRENVPLLLPSSLVLKHEIHNQEITIFITASVSSLLIKHLPKKGQKRKVDLLCIRTSKLLKRPDFLNT